MDLITGGLVRKKNNIQVQNMRLSIFEYQKIGADWLASKNHALLADEMGLGKSAQAITAADKVNALRVAVLCPASARINWLREFDKFSKLKREFTLVQSRTNAEWKESVVCSFDLVEHIPSKKEFDLLIIDECHFLKTPTTKRTIEILGKNGLVHRCKKVWALSGTPAPNHPGELWPILYIFGLTTLKYESYIKKFCNSYVFSNRIQVTGAKEKAIPELKKILAPAMLRRRKEDVMQDLPPIHYGDIVVEPTPVDLEITSSFSHFVYPVDRSNELYETLNKQAKLVDLSFSTINAYSTDGARALEALATSVSTLRRYNGVQKVKAVVELLTEELSSKAYQKIVVFAIHRDVIEGLREGLRKFKPVTLYGGTPPERRQRNIDSFQKNKAKRVFIGNIQAAGTAITLTAANQVMFVEQDWVPGNNAQAAMRCHRIGQTKPVNVRFVGIADSIDEKISHILRRKTAELTKIFDEEREKIFEEANLFA